MGESGPKNNLDVIRTLLALGVLSFHAFQYIGISYPQLPWVPAFIAISGYLVTDSMYRSRGYGHFAWKRFLRVGPAFFLSLALVAITGRDVTDALIDWSCFGLCWGGSNLPLWSLSLEETLYLLLAICFAARMYRRQAVAFFCLCAIFAVAAAAEDYVPSDGLPIIKVVLSFVSGSLLYVARDRVRWSPIAGAVCMALVVWIHNWYPVTEKVHDILVGPLLAYGLLSIGLHARPVFAKYKSVVGDPSLGIYVYHFPILLWLVKDHGITSIALYPLALLMTLPLALLSWHIVEKRALNMRDIGGGAPNSERLDAGDEPWKASANAGL